MELEPRDATELQISAVDVLTALLFTAPSSLSQLATGLTTAIRERDGDYSNPINRDSLDPAGPRNLAAKDLQPRPEIVVELVICDAVNLLARNDDGVAAPVKSLSMWRSRGLFIAPITSSMLY